MKEETMSKKALLEEVRELRRQVASLTKTGTERVQLEEGLRIQREKYRSVFDSIRARVWYFDSEGRIRRVNSTVVRDLGLPAEAVIGKMLREVFPFDQAKKMEAANREIIASGEAKLGVIEEYELSSGAKGWAQYDKLPYYDKKGEIAGVIVFSYDITERTRAEAALRQAEKKYRSIFEHAREGIFQSTPEGSFLSANPACARIFGFESAEELTAEVTDIGSHLYAHSGDRKELAKLIEDKGFVEGFECQGVRKDGKSIWVSVNARAVRDAAGIPLYYEGTIEDVTARKEAEEALLASQLRVSEAMELARIVYWEVDPTTGEFILNDPFYALCCTTAEREGGYRVSREEYGKRFVHPDDMPLFEQAAQKRLASREREFLNNVEHRIIRRDGEVRHILARVHESRDASGRVTRYYGANQDVTDQKRAEEALVLKTAFLEALVHSSCEGIYVVDDRRRKVLRNRRYIELRKLPQDIADEEDDKKHLQYVAATVRNPERYMENIEYLYSHPYETSVDETEMTDGTILERYSAPVIKDGTYYGRIWTLHDVTHHKRAEDALRWETTFLQTLLNSSQDGLLVLDRQRQKVIVNQRMTDMWKIPEGNFDDEAIILHLMRAIEDPREFFEKIGLLHSRPDETVRMELELKDGVVLDAYSSPVVGKDDEHYGRIWTFRDITAQKRDRNMLEALSATDGLTGIANRRRFDEFFEHEWRRCMREQLPLALVLMDIDFFKEFNDHYGHLEGDDCLRQVAGAVVSIVKRSGDLVARYGGEEFTCVLPNTDAHGAETVANRIRERMNDIGIPHHFSAAADHVTLSFGVAALIPQKEQNPSDLIQLADDFLYTAKQSGRNQVQSWRQSGRDKGVYGKQEQTRRYPGMRLSDDNDGDTGSSGALRA
jgi:diguanylate cyclase (GGDEF)-like protein/PAS domain S-box-containing protein